MTDTVVHAELLDGACSDGAGVVGRPMPTGTFVLADIGGYTRFLSDVGIEHAKEITSHLFNRMVEVERVAGRRATSSAMVGRQEVIGPALVVAHRSTPRVTSRA